DARSAWPTAVVIARRAAELGATAAADPDHTAPDAPVAIAHAGGAAQLARLRHLAAGVDAAFLATVVDGLTGNTISVAVTRAARPAAIAAILLEHAATAAADPHPTVAGTPVEAFAAIGAAQLLDQTHLATAIQRAFLAPVVDGLAGDLTVCIGHAAALEHAAAAVADPDAVTARAPAA